ncbi:hypothetical protein DRN58_03220 [Thermococci archaeon]|nr:MAG: hypothetical protein DRN58_03220 [Thermococci archaeon]
MNRKSGKMILLGIFIIIIHCVKIFPDEKPRFFIKGELLYNNYSPTLFPVEAKIILEDLTGTSITGALVKINQLQLQEDSSSGIYQEFTIIDLGETTHLHVQKEGIPALDFCVRYRPRPDSIGIIRPKNGDTLVSGMNINVSWEPNDKTDFYEIMAISKEDTLWKGVTVNTHSVIPGEALPDSGEIYIVVDAIAGPTLENSEILPNIEGKWKGTFSVKVRGLHRIKISSKGR